MCQFSNISKTLNDIKGPKGIFLPALFSFENNRIKIQKNAAEKNAADKAYNVFFNPEYAADALIVLISPPPILFPVNNTKTYINTNIIIEESADFIAMSRPEVIKCNVIPLKKSKALKKSGIVIVIISSAAIKQSKAI